MHIRIRIRILLLLLLTTVPGTAGVLIFGYYAFQDWGQLQLDYDYFVSVIKSSHSMEALFVAEAQQNIHRINLMADGIWTLLSAILAAIGLHGACVRR
ncbi:MAG: hypothetical protein AAF703_00025 [Cyanobacteria bacterium P01_D01_bin.105]